MKNRRTRTRIDYQSCITNEPTNQVCYSKFPKVKVIMESRLVSYCYYFLSPIEGLYLLWEKTDVISRKVMNLHYETLPNIGNDVTIDSGSMLDF